MTWKRCPRYWPFVGEARWPVMRSFEDFFLVRLKTVQNKKDAGGLKAYGASWTSPLFGGHGRAYHNISRGFQLEWDFALCRGIIVVLKTISINHHSSGARLCHEDRWYIPIQIIPILTMSFCTLSRENRVVRNRYSRLSFTSKDRLCTKTIDEYDVTIPVPTFAWRHKSTVVTSQC